MGNTHSNKPILELKLELEHEADLADANNIAAKFENDYPYDQYVYSHGFNKNIVCIKIYDKKLIKNQIGKII